MSQRLSASDRVELPMLRRDIADHLGLKIETVLRTLAELVRGGMVALDAGHRGIALRTLAALRQLSAGSRRQASGKGGER